MRRRVRRLRRSTVRAMLLAGILVACARREGPPPTEAERKAHKAAIAAAAQDRLVLQYMVKDADAVNLRVPTLRKQTAGFVSGDTNVIWFAFFAGDTLLVLDETRRGPSGVEENGRYLFRGDSLYYVALDRIVTAGVATPVRTRLAFGFDSTGRLAATSKNVNDAAVPLDTAADIGRLTDRVRALRARVLSTAGAR